MFTRREEQGFSLIELVVYITLSVFVLLALGSFVSLILKTKEHNQAVKEVEVQGMRISQIISDKVRDSSQVVVPDIEESADHLIIKPRTGQDNIRIYQSDGTIFLEDQSSQETALTNSRVKAGGLDFQNVSRSDTPGSIKFEFRLENKQERYDYSQKYSSAVSVR